VLGLGCDYRPLDFSLGGRISEFGLPLLVQSDLVRLDVTMPDHCIGTAVQAEYFFNGTALSQSWDFGDPASGAANTSTLESPTHTFSSAGTYTVTVTVQTPDGPVTATTMVTVSEEPVFNEPPDLELCEDPDRNSISLSAIRAQISTRFAQPIFFYPTLNDLENDTNRLPPTLVLTDPVTEVWVLISEGECDAATSFIITILPDIVPPEITGLLACDEGFTTATFDLTALRNELEIETQVDVTFHLTLQDAVDGTNALNPVFDADQSLQILFVRFSDEVCDATANLRLEIERCPFEVPNVLTPNDDQIQDRFTIIGLRDVYPDFRLKIFNRYGTQIWEGTNDDPDWQGEASMGPLAGSGRLPSTTYYYVLEPGFGLENVAGYVHLLY
jgi:gliding motility-associated-like protein